MQLQEGDLISFGGAETKHLFTYTFLKEEPKLLYVPIQGATKWVSAQSLHSQPTMLCVQPVGNFYVSCYFCKYTFPGIEGVEQIGCSLCGKTNYFASSTQAEYPGMHRIASESPLYQSAPICESDSNIFDNVQIKVPSISVDSVLPPSTEPEPVNRVRVQLPITPRTNSSTLFTVRRNQKIIFSFFLFKKNLI